MKLIQILALTAAMATLATAQNPGGSNPPTGSKPASPTPTPAKSKGAATTKKAKSGTQAKAPAATKGTPAKAGATPNATGKAATSTAPAGKQTVPATAAAGSTKAGATKAGATKAGPAPQLVAKPSPVPATKAGKVTIAPASGAKKKSTKGAAVAGKKGKPAQPKLAEVTPPQKAEKKKPAQRLMGSAGRRDPFVSPIRSAVGPQGPGAGCTSGKRCLAIPELVLRGTVRDISGKMLAVVSNSSQRTYTLRENDQVFNGSVEKITSDSIIFREFVKDALGRETAREVVKKLGPTS